MPPIDDQSIFVLVLGPVTIAVLVGLVVWLVRARRSSSSDGT